jgi:hypothetical protein
VAPRPHLAVTDSKHAQMISSIAFQHNLSVFLELGLVAFGRRPAEGVEENRISVNK